MEIASPLVYVCLEIAAIITSAAKFSAEDLSLYNEKKLMIGLVMS